MLDRRVIVLILVLALGIGLLWWNWKTPEGVALQSGQPVTSSQRYYLDLGGTWRTYSSLREAWAEMSDQSQKAAQLMLPSSTEFKVAARIFKLEPEWSARTMLLAMHGVEGKAQVYLNGTAEANLVGTISGTGGRDVVEVPAAAFRYGEDNIVLIRMVQTDNRTLFTVPTLQGGRVLGKIDLEGVTESSLELQGLDIAWERDAATVNLNTVIKHHVSVEQGPWTVNAVVSDGSALVAEQTLTLQGDGRIEQEAAFSLRILEVRLWKPEDPFLYQVHLVVSNTRGDRDDLAFPLGIRSLTMAEGKWMLNGEEIKIKGIEISPAEQFMLRSTGQVEAWLREQLNKGVNLVYFNGPVPDEMWLQAADRLGIGIWAEWPVSLRPAANLPEPSDLHPLVTMGELHPSLLAWTVGKGLEAAPNAKTKNYLHKAEQEAGMSLPFYLRKTGSDPQGFPADRSPQLLGNKIQGTWGEVMLGQQGAQASKWPAAETAAEAWAGLAFIVWLLNVRAVSWRYKEIGERKPKRRLRSAWAWHGTAVLVRAGTLAGIVTNLGYRMPSEFGPWFPRSRPLLELIQAQSPWLWWAVLTGIFTLLRLLQLGIVAPYLPGSPHPMGLAYWLERRYRWNVAVAILWALSPLGIALLFVLGAYIIFNIVFIPWRLADIHRVGGRYKAFFIVPGIVGLGFVGLALFYGRDILFLINFLYL